MILIFINTNMHINSLRNPFSEDTHSYKKNMAFQKGGILSSRMRNLNVSHLVASQKKFLCTYKHMNCCIISFSTKMDIISVQILMIFILQIPCKETRVTLPAIAQVHLPCIIHIRTNFIKW